MTFESNEHLLCSHFKRAVGAGAMLCILRSCDLLYNEQLTKKIVLLGEVIQIPSCHRC